MSSEHSINLRSKRWDETGKLMEETYLLETDARWARLQDERKRDVGPVGIQKLQKWRPAAPDECNILSTSSRYSPKPTES